MTRDHWKKCINFLTGCRFEVACGYSFKNDMQKRNEATYLLATVHLHANVCFATNNNQMTCLFYTHLLVQSLISQRCTMNKNETNVIIFSWLLI